MSTSGKENYNAVVSDIRRVHDDLMVLRVVPDADVPLQYEAGQYTALGLGAWERRDDGMQLKNPPHRMVQRAYSFSCSMLDEAGHVMTTSQTPYAEFYITRVKRTTDDPPVLTPRLFALSPEDRLFIGPHAKGHYTVNEVRPDNDVLFFATGTGEAPHNALVAELLSRGHTGRILTATCVRHRIDLAYLTIHQELERRFANYFYVPLTTREPENLDSSRSDFVGKQYLQQFLDSGQLEEVLGKPIEPERTHVYLCGNPAMIGLPQHLHGDEDERVYPKPLGMSELLTKRGFQLDAPHMPGNVHFEKYW